jgi:hypothetical protein
VMQHDLALNFGRPAAAERAQDEMVRLAYPDSANRVRVQVEKVRDALYWDGDTTRGAAVVAELERDNQVPGPSSYRNAREFAIVEWKLWHNDTTGARDFITRLRKALPATSPPSGTTVDGATVLDALLAVVSRRPDAAQLLKRVDESVRNAGAVPATRNRMVQLLYERQGNYEASLAAARRRLYWGRTMLISSSVLQEARMAALTGDSEAAIRAYRHYIALNYAPELSVRPRLDRARAQLARLEADHN